MKAMYSAPPGKAWRLGKGPFIFSGMPPACTGELELINTSEEKVKVRAIPAIHKKEDPAAGVLSEVQLGASIAPRGRVRVPAHFRLDPCTPAGTYKTTLSCGKQREAVIVHVFENNTYKVDPQRLFLFGSGGETISRMLVIRNTGNVTFSLPDVSMVWLEERDWVGRTLVYTLRESPNSEGHQKYLDRVMGELRSTMIPATRVFLDSTPQKIKPGDVAQILLKLTLPKELKKGRTYLGFIKMPSRRFWLEIECIGARKTDKRRRK